MSKKRTTMKDIARLAGVTQATVSYVINGTANISDEVKERVNKAIEQLDYRPNYNARALKTNTSNVIGIILPDIVNQYYSRMAKYLESLLVKSNHHTMIYTTSYDPDREEEIIKRLLSYDVHGIIVLYQLINPQNWDILKRSGKEIVSLEGGTYCSQLGIPNLHTDGFSGEYAAAKYLLDKGVKRIAFIHQTAINDTLQNRFLGYVKAMQESGLFNPQDVFYLENTADFYSECKRIGAQIAAQPYDGILSTSDSIAISLIRQLLINGKKVPDDVRIIGFDNVPLAEQFIPSLTTVSQPSEEICRQIISILFHDPESGEPDPSLIKPQLIIRESA
ncbi:MAG: LacI family DNA-binding transcriptional regulator [Eubacterium sp.]|nr:LacI family DNA-binding transcriptional regulator [Eubacterium sp.]